MPFNRIVKNESSKTPKTEAKIAEPAESRSQEDLSWREIISKLNDLNKSNKIKVQLRNINKKWSPFISDLKRIVKEVEKIHTSMIAPNVNTQTGPAEPLRQFLDTANKMIKKAEFLIESVNYNLYLMPNEESALEIKADCAVIVFQNQKTKNYQARILAKKNNMITENVDEIVDIPMKHKWGILTSKYVDTIGELNQDKNESYEVILNEKNIDAVTSLTKKLAAKAGVNASPKSLKELLTGAITLNEDLPILLDAFEKLPIVPALTAQLKNMSVNNQSVSIHNLLDNSLPIKKYRKLRQQAFEALDPQNFEKLSRDKQALALSLMESYNTMIKFAVLMLDKIEIDSGLIPGSLTTKIKIFDNKSISELCAEFNEKYKGAMAAAKFTAEIELYPYSYSIHQQRKAMLKALSTPIIDHGLEHKQLPSEEEKKLPSFEERKAQLKPQIEALLKKRSEPRKTIQNTLTPAQEAKRVQIQVLLDQAREIKELPKTENITDFTAFLKKTFEENYQKFKTLHHQLKLKTNENGPKLIDQIEQAKSMMANIDSELKNILDEKIYEIYFAQPTQADINSHWIHQAGSAFHHVKKMIEKVELLQQQHRGLLETNSPFAHVEQRLSEASELISAGTALVTSLHQLQGNRNLNKLISMHRIEIESSTNEYKEKAIAYKQEATEFYSKVKSSSTPLQTAATKLKNILMDNLNPNIEHKATATAIENSTLLVRDLETLYQAFNSNPDKKPNLAMFAINHFKKIHDILISLPQTLSLLNKLSQADAKDITLEINLALKQIILLGDKLEIELCLKQGYLTNKLRPTLSSFTHAVNQLGYDFKDDDRYPFSKDMHDKRMRMLNNAETTLIQKNLIKRRLSLNNVEQKKIKPNDLSDAIEIKLAQLKKQRGATRYFHKSQQAKLLEQRINICEKILLHLKEYNLKDTINMLSAAEKKLFNAQDSLFQKQLEAIEQSLQSEQRSKTLLLKPKERAILEFDSHSSEPEDKAIYLNLIDNRITELKSTFFVRSKSIKSNLLSALKDELNKDISLETAIHHIKANKKYAPNIHLLFEGSSGKMLRAAQNLTLSKIELIHRIDAEINNLTQQNHAYLRVFAKSRKEKIAHRIQVLENLKTTIKNSNHINIKEVIKELSPGDKNILKHYEPDLIQALEKPSAQRQNIELR